MTAGSIVTVDWRDGLLASGEPNKIRPAVVVGSARFYGSGLPFEVVVPLTGEAQLAITGASVLILPKPENGCSKPCYALAWNVQTVPHARITPTVSRITPQELAEIRDQIAGCVAACET